MKLINEMRRQYLLRLIENLGEAEVFDKRGNMLLTRDLKVTHRESGFEYTVFKVKTDPATGKVLIYLRKPDEPRFEKQSEPDLFGMSSSRQGFTDDDDVFVISQDDFERDYEVE